VAEADIDGLELVDDVAEILIDLVDVDETDGELVRLLEEDEVTDAVVEGVTDLVTDEVAVTECEDVEVTLPVTEDEDEDERDTELVGV